MAGGRQMDADSRERAVTTRPHTVNDARISESMYPAAELVAMAAGGAKGEPG